MGRKGLKLATYVAKNTIFKPYYEMVEEVHKFDAKQYTKLMSQVDRNIIDDLATRDKAVLEVHQLYDSTIHHHDFW